MKTCAQLGVTPSHPSGGEGWGEGVLGVSAKRDQYGTEHPVGVFHHVSISEAENSVSTALKRTGSYSIIGAAFGVRVAVHFNRQPLRARRKVHDVRRNDGLLLEFHTEPVGAKMVPQPLFGLRQSFPKGFGAIPCLDVPLQTTPSPGPLPLLGERESINCPLSRGGERISVARHARTPLESMHLVNA